MVDKRMRQLTKLQNILFLTGGLLMVVGAGCYAFLLIQHVAAIVFLVGALLFAGIQIQQRYDGNSVVIRRLRNIMTMADFCFVLAALLMVEEQFGVIRGLFAGHGDAYVTFVSLTYGKWVVILLIAAILEIYTMHRISNELDKE